MISIYLTAEYVKCLESNYNKATLIFIGYWSIYLFVLICYYQTVNLEQIVMFCGLFYMVHILYQLSGPDVFYELRDDPIIILDKTSEGMILVNSQFVEQFKKLSKIDVVKCHTKTLTTIPNPDDLSIEFYDLESDSNVHLMNIISNIEKYNGKEVGFSTNDEQIVFMVNAVLYDKSSKEKIVIIFKDVSEIHMLEKEKSANRYKTVLMGCLTHELRTPVN